jgi:hypothetical protein
MNLGDKSVPFEIVAGRGAASGQREYRELKGSIRAQKPHFKERGLNLDPFFEGTINARLPVERFEVVEPIIRIRGLVWLPGYPGENFDFCVCALTVGGETCPGLVYYPRPETKSAYAAPAPPDVMEILAPKMPGIRYGSRGTLHLDSRQVRLVGLRGG